jgi:hypothetical protein
VPSTIESSTAVTVTFTPVSQLADVRTTEDAEMLHWLFEVDRLMVTLAPGWLASLKLTLLEPVGSAIVKLVG